MATWGSLRSTFYTLVGDVAGSNIFFTPAQVRGFANKALRDAGQKTFYKDYEYTGTAPADSAGVAVGDVYAPWRGESDISGTSQVMTATTMERILKGHLNWASTRGTLREYYTDQRRSGAECAVGFYPKPGADTDIRFYFYAVPDEVDDAELNINVDIPAWASAAILFHMLYQAYRIDSKKRDISVSGYYKMLYNDVIDSLTVRVNSKIVRKADSRHRVRNQFDLISRSPSPWS